MNDDAEASEEQHVVDRGVAVSLRVPVEAVQHVEAERERQVGGHRQSVGYGQAGEDTVDGGDHVGSRQNDDVERVGDDAEDADDAGEVAVVALVQAGMRDGKWPWQKWEWTLKIVWCGVSTA